MEKEKSRYIEEKLNRIFIKDGYVPSRGNQSYEENIGDDKVRDYVNCMGHACFNLKNEHIKDYNIKLWDDGFYFDGFLNDDISLKANADNMKDFIKHIGLKIENSSPKYKLKDWRSWKVALYFEDDIYLSDYHYMLQERDGSWSSKSGDLSKLEYYEKLPLNDDGYKLFDCFSITNPNADGNNKYINRNELTCIKGLMKHLRESKLKELTGKEVEEFEMEK